MSEFEAEVVEYVKKFYQQNGAAPSIRLMIKNINNCSRSKIYATFKGVEDICSKAEIPYPKDRVEKSKKFSKKKIKLNSVEGSNNDDNDDIKLTKSQILRINTISHIEKGKSTSKVIDNLLNLDSLIRIDNLDHDKINEVSSYLSEAKNCGIDPITLLALQVFLNKAGFQQLDQSQRERLLSIALYLDSKNMDEVTFIKLYNRYIKLINIVIEYVNGKIGIKEMLLKVSQV
ncbi:MAG: hypothetical protein NTV15_08035 [Candidatus Bathyarchaeota archaeon]|nr:hypothetical protein [Candidatus Bathyarchaeota archaeon]